MPSSPSKTFHGEKSRCSQTTGSEPSAPTISRVRSKRDASSTGPNSEAKRSSAGETSVSHVGSGGSVLAGSARSSSQSVTRSATRG